MEDVKPLEFYDRYSRQYYVLGGRAMSNMENASVLICGLGGLGVEIAKCVTLAGVRSITLQDTQNTTLLDFSTQYYLIDSLGKNRAEESRPKIGELNPYVKVDAITTDIFQNLEILKNYSCVY